MNIGRLIYVILTYGSIFTVGTTLFTMGTLAVRRPRRWGWYFGAKLGMLLIIGTILALVLPNPVPIPPSTEAATYISGTLLFGVCLTGISRDILYRTAKGEVEKEVRRGKV